MSVKVDYAGVVRVTPGGPPFPLYPHQQEAIEALDRKILRKRPSFAGLLVIPTGGGKTHVAVRWLLRNVIDRGNKVLWIAHRHELLNQAFDAVLKNAHSDVMTRQSTFRYRIISGQHDKPVNIRPEDNILIASKDSLRAGMDYVLDKWVQNNTDIFLVVDEAHHATAKTYRRVINTLKEKCSAFKMLGLTATPFRTAEAEQGLLAQVFTDDIVYTVDLRTLIGQGILAQPIFRELSTGLSLKRELTEQDVRNITALDELPEDVAKQIAESDERNKRIVSHYVDSFDQGSKSKYGQLIVFAVNVTHAIALSALFNAELNRRFGTKGRAYADFVVGDLIDAGTRVHIAQEENEKKINRFRSGEIKVLVNVVILTEGTDLPKAQTVFLTRPTTSTVLMTQMIGRVLRGEKAGGTKEAYIVSFVDNWQDKISWASPQALYIDPAAKLDDDPEEYKKRQLNLVAVEKIEEFARMMNERVPELEALGFLQRVPVGFYSFSVLLPSRQGDEHEKNCVVMVFEHSQQCYTALLESLEPMFREYRLADKEELTDAELDQLYGTAAGLFEDAPMLGYREEDIRDILRYYAQKGVPPPLLRLEDREKYDIKQVAQHIYEHSLGGRAEAEYVNPLWDDEKSYWKLLFGNQKQYFIRQLSIEKEAITFGRPVLSSLQPPSVIKDERDIGYLSLSEMREKAPEEWRKLSAEVFARQTDAQGYIFSAVSEFKSKNKRQFQIDHIVPMSKGGLSTLQNLQVLTRWENATKGAKSGYLPRSEPTSGYCFHCKCKRPIRDAKECVWSNGRRGVQGICTECGTRISQTIRNK